MDASSIHTREREFHDRLARELSPSTMPPRPPDPLEQALLDRLADVSERSVLDLGCGTGDLSLELLRRGGRVTGLDLSAGMVAVAEQRARTFVPSGSFVGVVAPVETNGLPDAAFDFVVGRWILHHVSLPEALQEIRRLLAPGGQAVFIENSVLNPALRFARRHLTGRFGIPRYGTEDEHPFDRNDYALIQHVFPWTQIEFPDFTFFRLADRQLLRARLPRVSWALAGLDRFIQSHVPSLRRYSFRVLITMRA
jgi:SAM-dependent methyltransferase